MDVQTTVMVAWSKGWTSASHTYLVEVGDGAVWGPAPKSSTPPSSQPMQG